MNICIVSTFDGTTEDFMEIYNSTKPKMEVCTTDMEVGIVREGKVIVMANITNMEKLQEIMSFEEMKAWDVKFNNVDVVYSLEKQS